jgi:uncharacterized coiled-coil DUF342 family protein
METSQIEKTAELRKQVRKIISMCDRLKEEKEELIEENRQIVEKLQEKEREFNDLSDKFEQLKLTRTFAAGSDEAHEGKILVNRMVREIDKCIALLNR